MRLCDIVWHKRVAHSDVEYCEVHCPDGSALTLTRWHPGCTLDDGTIDLEVVRGCTRLGFYFGMGPLEAQCLLYELLGSQPAQEPICNSEVTDGTA